MDSTMSPQMRQHLYTNRNTHDEIGMLDVFTSDDNYLTLFGMSELDGVQLVYWLTSAGYRTDVYTDGSPCWRGASNNVVLVLKDNDGGDPKVVEPTSVSEFLPGAQGQKVFFREYVPAARYTSAYHALSACSHIMNVAAETELSPQEAALWFEASNGMSYFACAAIDGDQYVLELYPQSYLGTSAKVVYDNYVEDTMSELAANLDDSQLPSTVTEECFDEHGWVTDYAFMKLSGDDLVQALKAKGYSFVPSEQFARFKSLDGKCELQIKNGERGLNEEEIAKLGVNGGGEPVCCVIQNTGYGSDQEAFKSMQTAVLADCVGTAREGRTNLWAVVGDNSDNQDLLNFFEYPDGTWQMWIYTRAAVSSDAFEERGVYGTTIEQLWRKKTDLPIGDHMKTHPLEWR